MKYGLESGYLTDYVETGGPVASVAVTHLIPGKTYHFAVLAFNSLGTESPWSGEISYLVPSGGAPEISVVKSPSSNLIDGQDSGTLGSVVLGDTGATQAFDIINTGSADLTNLALVIDGTGSSDFILSPLATTTLGPGARTTFSIAFRPTAGGTRHASVHISSNDADESPFDIPIHGDGLTYPEIEVENSLTGELADGISRMDFGDVPSENTGSPATITIRNAGTAPLAGLLVICGGPQALDFFVGTPDRDILAPGESTSFQVVFKPSAPGARTATLQILNNDRDEGSFDIALTGYGIGLPQIAVAMNAGSPFPDNPASADFASSEVGMSGPQETFTISNSGFAPLTDLTLVMQGPAARDFTPSPLSVTSLEPGESTTFRVTFTPTLAGQRDATLRIGSNDPANQEFDVSLSGTGVAPPAPAMALEDAGGLPVDPGGEAFPSVPVGSAAKPMTYRIRNIGNVNLSGIRVSTDGADARSFLISPPGATFLTPGGSTTFTITFRPDSAGEKTAGLRVIDSLAPGGRFELSLAGTGFEVPEIKVISGDTEIPSGGVASMDFGTLNLRLETEIKTLVIKNTGGARLTNLRITNEGPHARDFSCSEPKSSSIAPGKSTTFNVSFNPTAAGSRSTTIRIESNSDSRPILLTCQGQGVSAPEIRIGIGKTDLVDDKAFVDFGSARIGQTGKTKEFTISNVGSASLKKLSLWQGGIDAGNFTVTKIRSRSLKSGKSTTFKVTFKARKNGISWGALRITSNDKDEKSFDIVLTGTGSDNPVKKTKKKKKKKQKSGKKARPPTPANLLASPAVDLAPVQGVEVIGGRKYRTLTIAKTPGSTVLPGDVEVSSDLIDWASGPRHTTVLREDSKTLKVRDNTSVTSEDKRFIRIHQ